MAARFKVAYVQWWKPVRLAVRDGDQMRFVGWVWRQTAYLVNNLNHGWVAFVCDQTEEKLKRCPCCKQYLAENQDPPAKLEQESKS